MLLHESRLVLIEKFEYDKYTYSILERINTLITQMKFLNKNTTFVPDFWITNKKVQKILLESGHKIHFKENIHMSDLISW